PPWLIVVQGSATPSPVPTFAAPASSPPTPLPTPPAVVRTAVTPGWVPDPCGGRLYEGKHDLLGVVPGAGSATVSWLSTGDDSVASYRVAAISQDLVTGAQPLPVWVTVPPGTACVLLQATVTGLTSGGRYVFWLTAILSREPREVMIGRSGGVRVD
ncbi:MAG: hypothetical protein JXA67_13020, partial [Micromonosporaceae bacterium]|nr:hypothetical protein [Micromonosporaceae bacterium]